MGQRKKKNQMGLKKFKSKTNLNDHKVKSVCEIRTWTHLDHGTSIYYSLRSDCHPGIAITCKGSDLLLDTHLRLWAVLQVCG